MFIFTSPTLFQLDLPFQTGEKCNGLGLYGADNTEKSHIQLSGKKKSLWSFNYLIQSNQITTRDFPKGVQPDLKFKARMQEYTQLVDINEGCPTPQA